MIRLYARVGNILSECGPEVLDGEAEAVIWIDLLKPDRDEISRIEKRFALDLPTRDEMVEIEPSDRLYVKGDTIYLTFTMLNAARTQRPERTYVTMAVSGNRLVTLRYADPLPFQSLVADLPKTRFARPDGSAVMTRILENIIDRIADLIEHVAAKFEETSVEIFQSDSVSHDFKRMLRELGANGELLTKCRESLGSISRLASFVIALPEFRQGHANRRLKSVRRDSHMLVEYAEFVGTKQIFLLDAILGLINIEQTGIIKIFSVLAIVFLPPTLIASIYGMNFELMPELAWRLGYPISLILMILSSILPYLYFKRRGWL